MKVKSIKGNSPGEIYDEKEIAVFGATIFCHFSGNGTGTEGSTLLLLDINPDYFKKSG